MKILASYNDAKTQLDAFLEECAAKAENNTALRFVSDNYTHADANLGGIYRNGFFVYDDFSADEELLKNSEYRFLYAHLKGHIDNMRNLSER